MCLHISRYILYAPILSTTETCDGRVTMPESNHNYLSQRVITQYYLLYIL